jgi:DNA helicase-2/ATP-dependent DNA helicase PcrA
MQEAGRFDHLLVDEYQDTNGSQYRIVKSLAGRHRNLCVVGDDDQSIYAWRGAEVAHILRFKRDWPEARVVRLETNYRSTTEILAWANRLIAFNKVRHPKTLQATMQGEKPRILQLPDETAEAKGVVEEIQSRIRSHHCRPGEVAVLFRTNEQPRAFETEFRRLEIPYVLVGGKSFFDRKEVRDTLAYVKLLANPRDEVALLRVINTPARGIGQGTVTRLTEKAVAAGKPLWELLRKPAALGDCPPAAGKAIGGFQRLIEGYRQRAKTEPLVDVVHGLVEEIGYRDEIARNYDDPNEQQARWAAVEELVNALGAYVKRTKKPSLSEFVQEIAIAGQDDDRDKEARLQRDAVALMTLHSAKGLEFPEVYLVGMEEGLLPHKRAVADSPQAVDEERRLCYVGVTRAQRRLTLTLALSRLKWGKARPTIPSRFLYELTGQADNPNYQSAKRQELPKRSANAAGKSTGRPAQTTGKPRRRNAG